MNPLLIKEQKTANEFVSKYYGQEIYEEYESLLTESKRISAGITDSRGADLLDGLQTEPQARMSSNFPQSSIEGGMAKRTLGGIIEAGETAAKVMRFRV